VTDAQDKRLIECIIQKYCCLDLVEDADYKFSQSGLYYHPQCETVAEYEAYIKELPLAPSPEAFGMDENCAISTAENEALILLAGIISLYSSNSSSSGGGKTKEEIMDERAADILSKIPKEYDIDYVEKFYPTKYEESMNTVLKQECIRYNNLLRVMHSSIPTFRKALKGLVVMSEDLEKMGNQLFVNVVPDMWGNKGFLSLKPLSSWQLDLDDRLKFLSGWIEHDKPVTFWVSGLFFPQAFLTGALQNNARKYNYEIDRLEFDYHYLPEDVTSKTVTEPPKEGIYIYGMYMEGARWDYADSAIRPSMPKVLYTEFPLMQLEPILDRPVKTGIYKCPVYKVLSRRGVLSTTGHSTNFVIYFEVPSTDGQDHWIRAGVAGFLALRT